ncbi:hypothetical protein YC2023_094560 [Brassica napus]
MNGTSGRKETHIENIQDYSIRLSYTAQSAASIRSQQSSKISPNSYTNLFARLEKRKEISGTADLKNFAEDRYINESKQFLLPHRRLRDFFSIKPHIILSQSVISFAEKTLASAIDLNNFIRNFLANGCSKHINTVSFLL